MQFDQLKRRAFITLLGAAAAMWPLAARAQQPLPVIGFLHQGSPEPLSLMNAFWKGLSEAGIIDIQDVTIEDRAADGHYDRLPALAVELAEHWAAVTAADFLPAALSAPRLSQNVRSRRVVDGLNVPGSIPVLPCVHKQHTASIALMLQARPAATPAHA